MKFSQLKIFSILYESKNIIYLNSEQKIKIKQVSDKRCRIYSNILQIQEMEKTILYSKKSSAVSFNIKTYETCQHQHCKQLVSHIKFLCSTLTQKLPKEQGFSTKNILKQKQNTLDEKLRKGQLNRTLQGQIQNIRKSYIKLRRQLDQFQADNDLLFQQNQNLKKKIEKIEENAGKKQAFQLSLTKCHQMSEGNSKNSFFISAKCDSDAGNRNQQDFHEVFSRQMDLKFEGIYQNRKQFQSNIDRADICNKYEQILHDFKKTKLQSSSNQEKLKQYEKSNRKLENENSQLKKIIKLRNQVQNSRHKTIQNLRSVLDQLGV